MEKFNICKFLGVGKNQPFKIHDRKYRMTSDGYIENEHGIRVFDDLIDAINDPSIVTPLVKESERVALRAIKTLWGNCQAIYIVNSYDEYNHVIVCDGNHNTITEISVDKFQELQKHTYYDIGYLLK